MKPAVRVCLVLVALLTANAGARDLPDIQERASLRALVSLDARHPEFFSLNPEAPGFDREILEGFAKMYHVTLEVVSLPNWDALIPSLLDRKGDVIAGRFTASETRRRSIAFTEEVFPRRLVVITRKPHRIVNTLEDLRAERVGTVKGTVMAEAIRRAGVPSSGVDDGIPVAGDLPEALRSGRVTAAVWGVESAIAEQHQDTAIQLGMFLGDHESLAFGLRKDDAQLLAALNEHIGRLHKSSAWNRLVVKYFGAASLEILKRAQ